MPPFVNYLMPRRFCSVAAALALALACRESSLSAAPPSPSFSPEQLAFFEKEVKPILAANCTSCHGAEKKVQSGLYLTSREGVLKGGENGPAVTLESPADSPLIAAINYQSFEMPPKGKLPQAQIEVLTKWVKMGLPWP